MNYSEEIKIKEFQELTSVSEEDKKLLLNKFPFSVFYKTEGNNLIIFRIFHNRRKPLIKI